MHGPARPENPHGGPLDGLPIAVKGRGGYTSRPTRRLLAHGAVPIGATSTPRGGGYQTWGHTDRGPTRNPWRGDLSPGGSSAGSAAAVAAGIVELGTGSDGAGSVRIPAAWCSVIGYKPTNTFGPRSDPTGLAVPGVLVRDPRLLRPWATAVLDHPPPATGPPVTAVWSPDLGFARRFLDDEVVDIAHRAARRLLARSAIAYSAPPLQLQDPEPAWFARRDPDTSSPRRRAAAALHVSNARILDDLFDQVDLLLSPTTPGRAHGHHGPGRHMSVALTWAFNLSGHPAVSIPAGFSTDGVPVGLQIVAAPGADDTLLALLEHHVATAPVAPGAAPACATSGAVTGRAERIST